jgi:hypothetical protein
VHEAYLNQVHSVLPRILSLYDTDSSSDTYGMGDRYHWAWGLIDFGNGTYQGAAHGLARLLTHDLLPQEFDNKKILNRIDAMFRATKKLCRKDGSMEEAFPYEGSFCVTALVAYDLISAVDLLEGQLNKDVKNQYLAIIRPIISYLFHADETHAVISNHLATAVAALYKWQKVTGEAAEIRGYELLQRILRHQSKEGWFKEYEGADPGYQTLCTYYLADVHRMKPELGLLEPLKKSIEFLWYFAHPDGSFGGIYGSRNTRFYYPAGIEWLSHEVPEAASLAVHMRNAINDNNVVSLSVMDEPNLIPMFNAYCWAATCTEEMSKLPVIPCKSNKNYRKYYDEAGLFVDRGIDYYTIVSTNKGGVVYHFVNNNLDTINTGVMLKARSGRLYSTQAFQPENKVKIAKDIIEIYAGFQPVTRRTPTPLQFLILRAMNVTIMRTKWLREKVKQMLVKLLITRKTKPRTYNTRKIHLGRKLKLKDKVDNKSDYEILENATQFVSIHMASQGYWQIQDDIKHDPTL